MKKFIIGVAIGYHAALFGAVGYLVKMQYDLQKEQEESRRLLHLRNQRAYEDAMEWIRP